MKTIQKSLLVSLIPLLAPLTAIAQTGEQPEVTSPASGKNNAGSWRASQVMGANVKSAADETIGEVEDVVFDMKTGNILAVIVSTGGFLGMADTLSALPVSTLRYDDTAKAFKTKLTKEQLAKAPQFKADAWPDYNEANNTEALHPYGGSNDGETTEPDNTAQNSKEQNRAENPTDQGNSEKDIQITKDIRSSIMNEDLSFNAKNIKIITRNEFVSLKGVVESDAEHQAILTIARNHANAAKISDELKVNTK